MPLLIKSWDVHFHTPNDYIDRYIYHQVVTTSSTQYKHQVINAHQQQVAGRNDHTLVTTQRMFNHLSQHLLHQ